MREKYKNLNTSERKREVPGDGFQNEAVQRSMKSSNRKIEQKNR